MQSSVSEESSCVFIMWNNVLRMWIIFVVLLFLVFKASIASHERKVTGVVYSHAVIYNLMSVCCVIYVTSVVICKEYELCELL